MPWQAAKPCSPMTPNYYRELKDAGGGVEVVPWLDHEALGRRIVELCADRGRIAGLIVKGAEFATTNTQEIWLDRRMQWTRELLEPHQGAPHRQGVRSAPLIPGP